MAQKFADSSDATKGIADTELFGLQLQKRTAFYKSGHYHDLQTGHA